MKSDKAICILQTPPRRQQQKENNFVSKFSEAIEILPQKPTSPPKHYHNGAIFDINISAESSSHWPLQRKSPEKISKAKQRDMDLLKGSGNDLSQFLKRSNVVFKSAIGDINLERLNENLTARKESESLPSARKQSYLRKPPTPPRKKTSRSNLQKSQLVFADNFQSSNIVYATRENESTFCVVTRFDTNTESYGQWFYFQVKNKTDFDQQYRIVILNMTKNKTFFGEGLKVSICRCGVWGKQGKDICYWKNSFLRQKEVENHQCNDPINITETNDTAEENSNFENEVANSHKSFYCLGFSIFLHAHQEVQISSNQPYTYSRICRKLDSISNMMGEQMPISIKRMIIGRSLLGNRIQMVTFDEKEEVGRRESDFKPKERNYRERNSSASQSKLQYRKKGTFPLIMQPLKPHQRQIILVLARAHPIQTAGSFILEGLIDQLVQNGGSSDFFQRFVVKVVPMINPDGVIIGNSRCNAKGYDLNRQWKSTFNKISPEIFCIKAAIEKMKSRVAMVIDLHSHSKQKSVFFYGCQNGVNSRKNIDYREKEFVYIMSSLMENRYIFEKSRWIHMKEQAKHKEGTARVALWTRLKTAHIYTVEASYCSGDESNYHYDETHYRNIGKKLFQSIVLYFSNDQENVLKKQTLFSELQQMPIRRVNNPYSDSESQTEERLVEDRCQDIDDQQDYHRLNSRQGSTGNIMLRKSYHRIKGFSVDNRSKNKLRNSVYHDSSQSKNLRKRTEPKQTILEREETTLRKSVKSFENRHNIQKLVTPNKNEHPIRSPIKIPRISGSSLDSSARKKERSHEVAVRPEGLKRAIIQSVNKISSNKNLKSIMQASSEMKKSSESPCQQPKTKSYQTSQIKHTHQFDAINYINEPTKGNQQQKISQFFQKVGIQVTKSKTGGYQIIKMHNKMHTQRINDVISKISNPKEKY